MSYVTLGDIAEALTKMRADGMTRASIQYALERVYWDQADPQPDAIELRMADPRDTPKALRETLATAQTAIWDTVPDPEVAGWHGNRLGRMIAEIDRQRPLGPDGKHGELHTPTCGCEDR